MKSLLLLSLVISQSLAALTIKIDYSLDSGNFFNTSEKKEAIEAVAKFYGSLIKDHLQRINQADFRGCSWYIKVEHPTTGVVVTIPNLIVPEDTIIVYVGGQILGGYTVGQGGPGGFGASGNNAWFDHIRGRGNAAAESKTPALCTDFAPWGGSIAFDTETDWNFSLSENLENLDFIQVALHEMGHVLGIGTANSWKNLKSSTGTFLGPASVYSYGSAPPLDSYGAHFDDPSFATLTSPAFGSFGRSHGSDCPVVMRPTASDDNVHFDVVTDLDLAALVDIGWEISPPLVLDSAIPTPASASFTWNSSSFIRYEIQRGTNLTTFPEGSGTIVGNGLVQSWNDAAAPADRAFYRLAATPSFGPAAAAPAARPLQVQALPSGTILEVSEEPRMVP